MKITITTYDHYLKCEKKGDKKKRTENPIPHQTATLPRAVLQTTQIDKDLIGVRESGVLP